MRGLIVDDHAILREGLKKVLAEAVPGMAIDEAESAFGALIKIRERPYDLVLLDIGLPDKSGLEILVAMHAVRPGLPVLMLTIYPEEQYAVRAMKAGAMGYLNKASAPTELVEAVETILSGKRYLTPSLAELLVDAWADRDKRAVHESLSAREFEVFRMIAAGKTLGRIADELGLSPKTVSTYRARILEKMKFQDSAQLMHYAIRNKIFE